MLQQEFFDWVGPILNISGTSLNLDSTLESLNWDSLVNMTFIAEFDEKFGVELNVDKLFEAKTLGAIFELVTESIDGV